MKKPVILIVEDNPTTRKLLRIALESEQYEVIEAADGQTALEQAKKGPALILQDLILPDMDGLSLNRKLREMSELRDTPILALSGFLSKVEEMHASDTGFTAFLVKPIDATHLLDVIQVYLPPVSSVNPEAQVGQGKCVLLVDDNLSQLKFIKLQLLNVGYKVVTATSGPDALEKIEKHSPDAVVSDVLMPHMDGFELCLAIRRDPRTCNLPVILLTANYLEEADRALARKVSANDFITRTSNAKELVQALEKSFSVKAPMLYPEPMDFFKEEHTHRLIRQLERQIINNTGLAQQCALQAAQLSLLGGVADALTSSTSIERTLHNVLTTCLDVAGISKGALYLLDKKNNFNLCQIIGYKKEDTENVSHFFNLPSAFLEILDQKIVIQIPSDELDKNLTDVFLSQAEVTSALLIPLISEAKCLGALFLGSKTTNITESGPITFAHTLGTQLGQAIALAKSFENIAESEQRYRSLMGSASCSIFIGNQNGEIIEVNKRGRKLLNTDQENIIGKKFIDFVIPSDQLFASKQLIKLSQEKAIKTTEVRIQPVNESQRVIEFSGVEVDLAKEKLLLLILNDVTEREQLRTKALLNDKLTTVGTLTAGIAHEINNPIASILANLSFLSSQVQSLTALITDLKQINQESNLNEKNEQLALLLEKQEKTAFLDKINDAIQDTTEAAEHIHDIVHDLKSFTRADEERITAIDINEVLNSAIKMSFPMTKFHAVVEKELSENIPSLLLNRGKLHQVFLNLIVNAAQAIPEGKTSSNKILVSSKIEDQFIRIDVTDTGQGVAPELVSKIFDPFFTTKSVGCGTGLGLTICREIINSLGGHIEVANTSGNGTTFSVYLPLKLQSKVAIKKINISAAASTRRRLLLIDDESLLLKGLQRILESFHDITAVADGQSALNIIDETHCQFDIIICDLNMPDVNGADVYQYIAEHYPNREQDIIFMSGGVYTQELMDFIANINNKHLEKPFSSKILLSMIDEHLTKK
jgi:PAS domain S-box-containing protein